MAAAEKELAGSTRNDKVNGRGAKWAPWPPEQKTDGEDKTELRLTEALAKLDRLAQEGLLLPDQTSLHYMQGFSLPDQTSFHHMQ